MNKINVVGTSGSGKSTFSRQLSSSLNYPYIEMDSMFWKPNWTKSSDKEFFESLEKALSAERWVLDGNYTRTAPIKLAKLDTVIWIDYSFPRTIYQAFKRAFMRSLTKQELWNNTGNVESFKKSFFSKNSVILWTLKTFKVNRSRYRNMFNNPQYKHINFIRITSPKMAKAFIRDVKIPQFDLSQYTVTFKS